MKNSTPYDTIIIGGGVSGLSAGVELAGKGAKVLVCEKSPRLGGRTSSFVDSVTGELVDNGQHLLMGCYSATRRYLRSIGSEHLADLQRTLRIPFLRPGFEPALLACPRLPSLLHAGMGIFGFSEISLADKLRIASVMKEVFLRSDPKELDTLTAEEWLAKLHQSEAGRKYLWDVMCIGALNNSTENVSALVFFRVLKEIFSWKRENSCFLLPAVPLSELFVDPAEQFIRSRGGEVMPSTHIQELRINGSEIEFAVCADGSHISARSYISAVPWHAVNGLFPSKPVLNEPAFRSAPIVNIHLWFDRRVIEEKYAAIVDAKIQWVFNVSRLLKNDGGKNAKRQHLSCVVSGAEKFVSLEKEELRDIALRDLFSVLPAARDAHIVHSLVVKEKRATFIPSPGLEVQRPNAETMVKNFSLAGDWTNTGFPSTIEGAIRSGVRAAKSVISQQ